MRAIAQADRRPDAVVVTSSSISSNGLPEFNGWFVVLPADCPAADLGAALADALEASQRHHNFEASPLARTASDRLAPVYAAVGVASARAYAKGAASAAVERIDGRYYLQPMKPQAGVFTAYGQEREYAGDAPRETLGAWCRAALDAVAPSS